MRIAISPDENPDDTGSVAADGTTERSVNLLVADALLVALVRCGQDAWFDPSLTFVQRVSQANSDSTSLLVACAHNESTPGKSGTQFVFCQGGQSFGQQAAAADAVYSQLVQDIPLWPARQPNVEESIYECCAFNGDTVYIEYCYMSPDDAAFWQGFAVEKAEATAKALASVYGFPYVSGGFSVTDSQKLDLLVSELTPPPPNGPGLPNNVVAVLINNQVTIMNMLKNSAPSQDAAKLDALKADLDAALLTISGKFAGLKITETA